MEEEHVKEALNRCGYPDWYVRKMKNRMECSKLKKGCGKSMSQRGGNQ